jgi:two-component system, LytTR family, response regulator
MKALIIDDEKLVRESLKALLVEYCQSIESISLADSLHNAALKIEAEYPDIVFLDIHMYHSNGLELLESLPERRFRTIIISGDATKAIDAIKMGVNDYLLKPIDIFELQKAVKKIEHLRQTRSKPFKISVPDGQTYRLLSPEDIIRIEAHSNYSKIFLADNKTLTVSKTLKNYEDQLESYNFFRPHKSHLVNVNAILGYSRSTLELQLNDGSYIPISRTKLTELIKELNNDGNLAL